jgi:hypothetical protein
VKRTGKRNDRNLDAGGKKIEAIVDDGKESSRFMEGCSNNQQRLFNNQPLANPEIGKS